MIPNTYFDEMYRAGCEWQKRHREYEEARKQIIETKGWDSPELKKMQEEPCPISQGAGKTLRAYRYSQGEELLLDTFLWDRERADFIDALRKAGVETFITVDHSTGLLEDIHGFIDLGCTLDGPCKITQKADLWGGEEEETLLGLRFCA